MRVRGGKDIAVLLFDGVTALDAVGPYEVLRFMPDARVHFVASSPGPKHSAGALQLVADVAMEDMANPYAVVVPGGPGVPAMRDDPSVLAWLRGAHATSRWTTSVCTGALILAAAGILEGIEATTHWRALDELAAFGARPLGERVVVRDRVITAGGVSAGIDMALRMVALDAGRDVAQAIQLLLEYDPQPPFDAGSPAKAPAHVMAMLSARGSAPQRSDHDQQHGEAH